MKNITSLKNIYAEFKMMARKDILDELTQEAIKEHDLETLQKIQEIKAEEVQE